MPLELSYQRPTLQLQPVIAEILRTCICPSSISLRVEQVHKQPIECNNLSENRHGHSIKAYLTDGELVVQALFHRQLCALAEVEDLRVGNILEIHKFVVKKAKRKNGYGHVLYLGIEDCHVIKNEAEQNESKAIGYDSESTNFTNRNAIKNDETTIDDMAGGFFPDYGESFTEQDHMDALIEHADRLTDLERIETTLIPTGKRFTTNGVQSQSREENRCGSSPVGHTRKRKLLFVNDDGSDDEAFETVRFDLHTAKKRREVLHELSQNLVSSPSRPPTRGSTVVSVAKKDGAHEDLGRKPLVRFEISQREIHNQSATVMNEKHPQGNGAEGGHSSFTHRRDSNLYEHTNLLGPSYPLPAPTTSRPTTPIHSDSQIDSYGPYHDLVSLYSPSLPSKSYTFTTLIIPTHVSTHLITRPNSPFPPKRHIKVIDASIVAKFTVNGANLLGKGVTVSVYRNAVAFKPTIGKAALMRGVVMQRITGAMKSGTKAGQGEVILNVYPVKSRIQKQSQNTGQRSQQMANDSHISKGQDEIAERSRVGPYVQNEHEFSGSKPRAGLIDPQLNAEHPTGQHWFVDDHNFLRQQGHDVDTMQQWWNKMMSTK